jgi:hypothetical protein
MRVRIGDYPLQVPLVKMVLTYYDKFYNKMFANSPIPSAYNYYSKTTNRYKFIIMIIISTIYDVYSSYYLTNISKGDTWLIPYFIIMQILFTTFDNYYSSQIRIDIECQIKQMAKTDGYQKYNGLSFQSKNKKTIQDFRNVMDDMANTMEAICCWGTSTITGMISRLFSSIIVFIQSEQYILIVFIFVINIMSYVFIISAIQKRNSINRKKRRSRNQKMNNILRLVLSLFHNR